MSCPICQTNLEEFDNKGIPSIIFEFFRRYANPFSPWQSVANMGIDMKDVGKMIYLDCANKPRVSDTYFCPNCKIYYVYCPHCRGLNLLGINQFIVKKIRCHRCKQDFHYYTLGEGGENPDPLHMYW